MATDQELAGERVFFGKGRCNGCHAPPTSFMDNNMHDLKLERFYQPGKVVNDFVTLPDGPIKTFTLRGIKDSPPYMHDGRLLTLADTVEFFKLVLGTKLTQQEKDALVAYMLRPMRRFIASASILAALTLPALAQIGNPAGVDPATPQSAPGVPAPNTTNTQDKLFAQLLSSGGLADVVFGKIAQGKAQGSCVKEFARRMVQDHSKANEQLERLAKRANIPLSGELGPDEKSMKEELDRAPGLSFDLAYMQGQLIGHQKAVILLQYEIGQGQDGELQRFAAESLPIVIGHLEMARAVMDELTGAATQVTTGAGARGSEDRSR
jgi:predicted outer membrane protein